MVTRTLQRVALSPNEAAETLGVSRVTIFKLMQTGELPSAKIGWARRIPVESIAALLESGRVSRTQR